MENIYEKVPMTYKVPAEEVSFLIRSCEDAVRLAEILRDFCIDRGFEGELVEANRLLAHVQYWDAPLRTDAWTEIIDLCGLVRDAVFAGGCREEEKYLIIVDALQCAVERKHADSKVKETEDRLLNGSCENNHT